MSTTWLTNAVGYDGDCIYGHVTVDQWQSQKSFEEEVDRQLDRVRKDMLAAFKRLGRE